MNTPLHLLETLVVFSQEHTVAATAEKLKTTQPTVTRHLQQLEETFEHPLFETIGRNKKLTRFGQTLARNLAARFHNLEQLITDTSRSHGWSSQTELTIAGRTEILRRSFGLKKFPNRVRLEPMSSRELKKSLLAGSVDVAILQDSVVTSDYIKKPFFSDEWILIVPSLFLKSSFEEWKKKASEFPYASYKKDMLFLRRGLEVFSIPACEESFVFPDWLTIEERVHLGFNWSVVPSSYVQSKRHYRAFKVPNLPPHTFFAYYKKSLSRSSGFKEHLDSVLLSQK